MSNSRPDIRAVIERLAKVNPRFMGIEITSSNTRGNWAGNFHCPLHDDPDESFEVNLANNTFHCFGCELKGSSWTLIGYAICGPSYSPESDWQSATRWWDGVATQAIAYVPFTPAPKKPFDVPKFTRLLHNWQKTLFWKRHDLMREHGITYETAADFGMGFVSYSDPQRSYFVIPYYRSNGKLHGINTRYWLREVPENVLKYCIVTGSSKGLYNGKVILNPANAGKRVFVVEDEWSVMALHQMGELAVAHSAGAASVFGNLREEWISYFSDVHPIVIADMDDTGQASAGNAAMVLETEVADLPALPHVKDFADYARLYPQEARIWLNQI
jgi:hypothetical protein